MIRTVCLNPVVDRMYHIDNFSAGGLWRTDNPEVLAGGKGINVARVVSLLGEKCALYTFLGGSAGAFIEKDVSAFVDEKHIYRHEGETRTTVNIIDRAGDVETEIKERGVAVSPDLVDDFLRELSFDLAAGDIVVCSGSAMDGMGVDIYRRIGEVVKGRGASCFLDTSGAYLKAALPGNFAFLKPNGDELRALFVEDLPIEELALRTLDLGVESVMVSLGGEGCIFCRGGRVFKAAVPKVEVVSTIGSGDATVAGFAVARVRGLGVEESVSFAMACGVSNAMHSGVGSVDRDEVEELAHQVEVVERKI